ncbi:hypothetical protein V0288_12085 [Pannus brasiliensis CCIBt3594]|uniref:Uncharacterized protein n=1 Tax=Pannus brasiliensis CCIBt3594 TaxID=1427578 RepID=A0AAW9QUV1_9CHRO
MTYTVEDFAREYELSASEVEATLTAIGLPTAKPDYSEAERERFARARELFEEGIANSYDDIAAFFENESVPNVAPEPTLSLEEQAIETGFQVGFRQAEIMGQVIPRVTVMRLKEMVATGELKQNFQQLWIEAMDAGNSTSVTARIDRRWREYQLERYQPLTSLPESSTESSDSD